MERQSLTGPGKVSWVLSIAVAMWLCAPAWTAPIFYGNFSGTTVDFLNVTEDSSTDPVPLHGAPSVTGDTLEFSPTAFGSLSPDGPATGDVTDGFLLFIIKAKPGHFIDTISLDEFGDFALLSLAGSSAQATVTGELFATDNVSNSQISDSILGQRSDTLAAAPFLLVGPGADSAAWTAAAMVDYTGQGVTEVQIKLNNTLQTTVLPGSSAFIAKKGLDITVQTSLIPEPGTLVLASGGLALIIGARWRDRRRA